MSCNLGYDPALIFHGEVSPISAQGGSASGCSCGIGMMGGPKPRHQGPTQLQNLQSEHASASRPFQNRRFSGKRWQMYANSVGEGPYIHRIQAPMVGNALACDMRDVKLTRRNLRLIGVQSPRHLFIRKAGLEVCGMDMNGSTPSSINMCCCRAKGKNTTNTIDYRMCARGIVAPKTCPVLMQLIMIIRSRSWGSLRSKNVKVQCKTSRIWNKVFCKFGRITTQYDSVMKRKS